MVYSKKYYTKKNHSDNLDFLQKKFLILNNKFPVFSNYYFQLFKVLNKIPLNGKVLDIGIASGTFVNFLRKIRPDLKFVGLDLTEISDLLPKNIKFIKADATKFKLKEKFDFIICNHLFEHLPVGDVSKVIINIEKHLTKNGYFWFTTPTFSKAFFNDPTHIRPYNKESMKRLLIMYGLKNYKLFEGYYFTFPLYYLKWSLKISYGYIRK